MEPTSGKSIQMSSPQCVWPALLQVGSKPGTSSHATLGLAPTARNAMASYCSMARGVCAGSFQVWPSRLHRIFDTAWLAALTATTSESEPLVARNSNWPLRAAALVSIWSPPGAIISMHKAKVAPTSMSGDVQTPCASGITIGPPSSAFDKATFQPLDAVGNLSAKVAACAPAFFRSTA